MGLRTRLVNRIRANAGTILRRRRLALFITALMLPLIFMSTQAEGVYYSRADVLFLPPPALVGGNLLQEDPTQTLSFAAIVEHRINAEMPSLAPRTTAAPLYGTGVRNTHSVYIPSSGGQWQLSFSRPVISVEVVADSASDASDNLAHLVRRVSEAATEAQSSEGIPLTSQIGTELSPRAPSASYVAVRNSRATNTLLILTLGMAGGIPILFERLVSVHRAKRQAPPAPDVSARHRLPTPR